MNGAQWEREYAEFCEEQQDIEREMRRQREQFDNDWSDFDPRGNDFAEVRHA